MYCRLPTVAPEVCLLVKKKSDTKTFHFSSKLEFQKKKHITKKKETFQNSVKYKSGLKVKLMQSNKFSSFYKYFSQKKKHFSLIFNINENILSSMLTFEVKYKVPQNTISNNEMLIPK